ncbi:hypothetical protein [Cupriavidus consociatus]|uniref:hypothetical protein n=1 Tax=Cupriavidus consociatus TaxID=2821357 RepID=UPI001AEB1CF5|nr:MULTISPECIES: hypothetical protein [unclassified Cupriavidus]MBP0620855.1 hypothetical protein [Cupriavidus sp. LEh25]MDK2657517.1 hypothetical protein [Cupriavidus sp. LEh21]
MTQSTPTAWPFTDDQKQRQWQSPVKIYEIGVNTGPASRDAECHGFTHCGAKKSTSQGP